MLMIKDIMILTAILMARYLFQSGTLFRIWTGGIGYENSELFKKFGNLGFKSF